MSDIDRDCETLSQELQAAQERIRDLELSIMSHFERIHLGAEGRELDRANARWRALANVFVGRQSLRDWRGIATKLREEKFLVVALAIEEVCNHLADYEAAVGGDHEI